ncbi:MAG: AAA family ATPase [Chloroflexi bacterium]|nr:AAA family ATPase [Chloroflexota bacterium]
MNNSHSENLLTSDTPLSNPDDDELGFAPFAQTLASSIVRMTPPEGLVIAVYAPWGSGKSTLINFVASYLREEPPENQPIIVTFNPWWFSGQENLRTRFFEQLLQTLDKSDQTFKELKSKITTFADAIVNTQLPHSQWAKIVPFILRTKVKDVQERKDDVVQVLRKQRNRILVIIDDIDRLIATEVKEMFQLIKAVADFPNVTYLLAMDKRVAIKALGVCNRADR